MTKTRKKIISFLVTVLLVSGLVVFSFAYFRSRSHESGMTMDHEVYQDAEHTLMGYLGMKDEGTSYTSTNIDKEENDKELVATDGSRMTQRVTIVSDSGVLPITGTVTKAQDAYYPGTYELRFGNNAILTEDVSVYVTMNVKEGDKVFILTGDRENGYVEYETVEVQKDNLIAFDTSVIQDYTISTTDIVSAQEAMALLFEQ